VHIAAYPIVIGGRFQRQRCGWCGAVLIDNDWSRMATVGEWSEPATWPTQGLVLIDGALATVVEHVDGDPLPPNCCALLDPAVTA
jgi:hypothetical protein